MIPVIVSPGFFYSKSFKITDCSLNIFHGSPQLNYPLSRSVVTGIFSFSFFL